MSSEGQLYVYIHTSKERFVTDLTGFSVMTLLRFTKKEMLLLLASACYVSSNALPHKTTQS